MVSFAELKDGDEVPDVIQRESYAVAQAAINWAKAIVGPEYETLDMDAFVRIMDEKAKVIPYQSFMLLGLTLRLELIFKGAWDVTKDRTPEGL